MILKISTFIIARFEASITKRSHCIHPSFTDTVDETSINPTCHSVDLWQRKQILELVKMN